MSLLQRFAFFLSNLPCFEKLKAKQSDDLIVHLEYFFSADSVGRASSPMSVVSAQPWPAACRAAGPARPGEHRPTARASLQSQCCSVPSAPPVPRGSLCWPPLEISPLHPSTDLNVNGESYSGKTIHLLHLQQQQHLWLLPPPVCQDPEKAAQLVTFMFLPQPGLSSLLQ